MFKKICEDHTDKIYSDNRKEKIAMLEISIFLDIFKEKFELCGLRRNSHGCWTSKTCMSTGHIMDLSHSFSGVFEGDKGFDQENMVENNDCEHDEETEEREERVEMKGAEFNGSVDWDFDKMGAEKEEEENIVSFKCRFYFGDEPFDKFNVFEVIFSDRNESKDNGCNKERD